MIEHFSQIIAEYILPLGPWGVFLASIAEEVVAPIPSALVMMTAGFIFVSGPVSFVSILKLVVFVALPAAVGVTLGSLWIYGAAWWGGKESLDRFGKWIGLSWTDVLKMKERFGHTKSEEISIITARIFPVVPSVAISAFCGFIRMKFWKYIVLTFVGMFLRALLMGAIGWQVGNIYIKYANIFSNIERTLTIIIGGSALAGLLYLVYSRRNGKISTNHRP